MRTGLISLGVLIIAIIGFFVFSRMNRKMKEGFVDSPVMYVTKIIGNGTAGSTDGPAIIPASATAAEKLLGATVRQPRGITVHSNGDVFIADTGNNRIRKLTASTNMVSTLAGNGTAGFSGNNVTSSSSNTQVSSPSKIITDSSGNVYFSDTGNNRVRKLTLQTDGSYIISTIVGGGTTTFTVIAAKPAVGAQPAVPATTSWANKLPTEASITSPMGLAFGSDGALYIACGDNTIIKLSGNSLTQLTINLNGGRALGFGISAGLAFYSNTLYISEYDNHCVRKISLSNNTLSNFVGSPGTGYTSGATDGTNTAGANVRLSNPFDVKVDSAGNFYIADFNYRIRKADINGNCMTIFGGQYQSDLAGIPTTSPAQTVAPADPNPIGVLASTTNGALVSAQSAQCRGVAVDASGSVYITYANNEILKLFTCPTNATCGTSQKIGATQSSTIYARCPRGSVLNQARNACVCAPGNTNINGVCTPCVQGTYSEDGITAITCPPGRGNTGTGNTSATTCVPCPAGQSSTVGICTPCPIGRSSLSGDPSCSVCPPGKTTTSAGQSPCANCAAGQTSTTGTCTNCLAGTYSTTAGSPSCTTCGAGTYIDITGQSSCKTCPTLAICTPSSYTCPPNSSLNPAGTACVCNPNYQADGSGCIPNFIKAGSPLPPKTRGTNLININRNIISGDPTKPANTYSYRWAGVSGTINANPCKDATPTFDFDTNTCVATPALATVPTTATAPVATTVATPPATAPPAQTCCQKIRAKTVKTPLEAYYADGCGPTFASASLKTAASLTLTPALRNLCRGLPPNTPPSNSRDQKVGCYNFAPSATWNACPTTSPFEDMSAGETIYSKRAQWFQNRQLLNSA